MRGRLAVVSVHDVTPAHERALGRIVTMLRNEGVGRASILVVPDYHGAWDVRAHRGFGDWLRGLAAEGHEIVLHGFQHEGVRATSPTAWQRMVRRWYSSEGEFHTLEYGEASRRIAGGIEILGALGFHPAGFVAPAWLQSPGTVRAARDRGLRYLTTLHGVTDLTTGTTIRARPVCFSSRSALRAGATSAYCELLSRWTARRRVVRIAIHPGDMARAGIVRRLEGILARARGSRTFVTYEDLVQGGDPSRGGSS